MCINNKMAKHGYVKSTNRGYNLWFHQRGRGRGGHGRPNPCFQVSTLQLNQILSCALNKPIISFFLTIFKSLNACVGLVGKVTSCTYWSMGLTTLLRKFCQLPRASLQLLGVFSSTIRSYVSCLITIFSYLLESTLILSHSHIDLHYTELCIVLHDSV